jgi:hypothetical protein
VLQKEAARFQFQYLGPDPVTVCLGFAPRGHIAETRDGSERTQWRDPDPVIVQELQGAVIRVSAISTCSALLGGGPRLYVYWPVLVPDGAEVELSRVGGWSSVGGFRAHLKRADDQRWRVVSQRTTWID